MQAGAEVLIPMQVVSCSRGSVFFSMRLIFYLAFLGIAFALPPTMFGAPPKESRKTYFLVLEGETEGEVHVRMKGKNSEQQIASAVSNRGVTIRNQQDALIAQLHAQGHIVSGRFSHVLNAIRVH